MPPDKGINRITSIDGGKNIGFWNARRYDFRTAIQNATAQKWILVFVHSAVVHSVAVRPDTRYPKIVAGSCLLRGKDRQLLFGDLRNAEGEI